MILTSPLPLFKSPLGHALFEKLHKSNSSKNTQTKNVKNFKEFVLIPKIQGFIYIYKKSRQRPGMVIHICNPSSWENEAGRSQV